MRAILTICIISIVIYIPTSSACTTVFWNANNKAKVVARSMDLFTSDQPTIMAYPRGIVNHGDTSENSLQWKSLYGSVVVTAFHTETVSDGINEKGLAAHLLYLHDTQYEKRDPKRQALSNTRWVQYYLDNFKTVNEAVAATSKFQVVSTKVIGKEWPLHVTLEDASGDSAIIEYINGKLHIHHGAEYKVMTNEPAYDIQLQNLKRYKLFGGSLSLPGDVDPLSRFVRASSFLKTIPQPENYITAIAGVFSIIRSVMVPFGAEDTSGGNLQDAWPTRWITIADLSNKIYYFSSTSTPNIIWIDLNSINFSAGAAVLTIDPLNIALIGEITKKLTHIEIH